MPTYRLGFPPCFGCAWGRHDKCVADDSAKPYAIEGRDGPELIAAFICGCSCWRIDRAGWPWQHAEPCDTPRCACGGLATAER